MAKKRLVRKVSHSKKRPIGVTVLSIWKFLGCAVGVVLALFMLIGGSFILSAPQAVADQLALEGAPASEILNYIPLAGGALLGMGIFVGLMGIISLILGIGLWKGKNWARIIEAVFAGIGIVMALISLFSGNFMSFIILAVIEGLIFWYLVFNKTGTSYFK